VTAQPQAPDYARQVPSAVPIGAVSDEERTSYGLLLDRAAERGLLDPSEYEVRLRRLAEATTTAQMVAIVSELPAFIPPPTPADHRSRSDIQSASRTAAGDGQRRRLIVWVLMGVLVGWGPWFPLVTRTKFYYYALEFEPFLILSIVLCLGLILGPATATMWRRRVGAGIVGLYVLCVLLMFWYFYPILAAKLIPYSDWLSHMWYRVGKGWI